MRVKKRNKFDEKTGHFLCAKCDREVLVGISFKGLVYHAKCAREVKEAKKK